MPLILLAFMAYQIPFQQLDGIFQRLGSSDLPGGSRVPWLTRRQLRPTVQQAVASTRIRISAMQEAYPAHLQLSKPRTSRSIHLLLNHRWFRMLPLNRAVTTLFWGRFGNRW